ncbi:MAG: ATP-binding protein [Thermacetogeniaceae bacterium]
MSDLAGKGCEILVPVSERDSLEEIERSIITRYRKHTWTKFVKAIKDFQLIAEGDRIAVAVSGGKDSLLMAKLFQEMLRHGKSNFTAEYISMDPGYHQDIRALLEDNCSFLKIPIQIFETKIFEIAGKIAQDYPCYMCAKMRRGALYAKAKELGCNKLALAHHFNDAIETTLLNLLYAGSFKTMLPKLKSAHFEGLELIRPLYYVEERHIEEYTRESGIWPLNCACMIAAGKTGNKRYEIKALIADLGKRFKAVDRFIFKAAQNVNMDCILGWQKGGQHHSYLDYYDE